MATEPVTLPATAGANLTDSGADWPGVSIMFVLKPLEVNPAPLTITPEIVTLAVPLFVSVTPSKLLPPTITLPKSSELTFELRSGTAAAALPATVIVRGELAALLATETLPLSVPAAVGT
jgi:hypothetical protein